MRQETYPGKQIFEGTIADILLRAQQIPGDRFAQLILLEKTAEAQPVKISSLKGKYAHIPGGSEAYALEKQTELAREYQ